MSLEDVKSDILNEAEQKSDQIVQEAEEEAEEILEEAEQEAERIKQETKEEVEEKEEAIKKKARSNARMKAKEIKLQEKQSKLDEAFDRFREKIEEIAEENPGDFVDRCAERAEFDVGKVIGSEEFRSAVSQEFEQDDSTEGIVLLSEDGERRVNFTYDRIVKDYRENLRKKVSEELFE